MSPSAEIIEVFADVACPFTHVGLRRFVERRTELGRTDLLLRVRAWPLELVNHEPLDAAFIAEEVEVIRDKAAPDLFKRFTEASFPTTSLPAFALAAAAYRQSDALGETVSLKLRDLLFEEGVDVADAEVTKRLATKYSLDITDDDRSAAVTDHAEGIARGVIGSPHFFTNGGGFFCPALQVGRDSDGELQVQVDREAFDKFMDACLTG